MSKHDLTYLSKGIFYVTLCIVFIRYTVKIDYNLYTFFFFFFFLSVKTHLT